MKVRPELMPRRRAEKYLWGWQRLHSPFHVMFSGFSPALSSTSLFASCRWICALPVAALRRLMALAENPCATNCSNTSSPTSKQSWQMLAPITATMRERSAPNRSIASTVRAAILPTVPRQPACATPKTPASASASEIFTQSAVFTPMHTPPRRVTSASTACRRAMRSEWGRTISASSTTATLQVCVWRGITKRSGLMPRAAHSALRQASTWARSSAV